MTASAAAADELQFQYTLYPGEVMSGLFEGTLSGDRNTFNISDVKEIGAFTGDFPVGNGGVTSLDGSTNDWSVTPSRRAAGFEIIAESFVDNSGFTASYDRSNWQASLVRPAGGSGGGGGPEPSTWALMMVGVFGAGAALRRRQGGAAAALAA